MVTPNLPADSALNVTVPQVMLAGMPHDNGQLASIRAWDLSGEPPHDPVMVVMPYILADPRLARLSTLPRLRVVQTLSAGVDWIRGYVPDSVILCNAAGTHEASTAETAIGLALTALRGIGLYSHEDVSLGSWPPPMRPSLADRRVLILGAGGIGSAIARRLNAFEASFNRVGRTRRDDELGRVYALSEVNDLVSNHDVVMVALPLTPETHKVVDANFLSKLPDGGLLVNVGRGPLVDTDALVAEVQDGRLLAALDVTDPEPLPLDHPLWKIPGVVITPHIGGISTAALVRARALVSEQISRLASGQPLKNVVK